MELKKKPTPKYTAEFRERGEGEHHTQALIALARRRVTVLWTMLQRRETFDPHSKAA